MIKNILIFGLFFVIFLGCFIVIKGMTIKDYKKNQIINYKKCEMLRYTEEVANSVPNIGFIERKSNQIKMKRRSNQIEIEKDYESGYFD